METLRLAPSCDGLFPERKCGRKSRRFATAVSRVACLRVTTLLFSGCSTPEYQPEQRLPKMTAPICPACSASLKCFKVKGQSFMMEELELAQETFHLIFIRPFLFL